MKAYFNHAGLSSPTTAVASASLSARETFRSLLFSEAGAQEYKAAIVRAKASIARLLCVPEEAERTIFLLPNATTGLSLILRNVLSGLGPKASVITSDQEHPAVERILQSAETAGVNIERVASKSEKDFVERVGVCSGRAIPALVVLSQVSYKDGRILPIGQIARALEPLHIPLVVDGTQGVGQVPLDLPLKLCAAYVFSGHKWLFAPMGIGGMYLDRSFFNTQNLTLDGCYDVEAGTLDYTSIVGLRTACDEAFDSLAQRVRRLTRIRCQIVDALGSLPKFQLPEWRGATAPGIISILLPDDVPSWEVAERVWTRHAVAVKPFRPPERPNAIRISFTSETSERDIGLLREALYAEFGA